MHWRKILSAEFISQNMVSLHLMGRGVEQAHGNLKFRQKKGNTMGGRSRVTAKDMQNGGKDVGRAYSLQKVASEGVQWCKTAQRGEGGRIVHHSTMKPVKILRICVDNDQKAYKLRTNTK